MDFSAHLMLHLQKEEMTVVQRLGTLLDPDVDHALALRRKMERDGGKLDSRAGEAA
jgi:hypothetical protein